MSCLCKKKCCKDKQKEFNAYFLDTISTYDLSIDNIIIIQLKYIGILKELKRLRKKSKLQYCLLNVVYYILFFILSIIPLIGQLTIDNEEDNNNYSTLTSISSIILFFIIQPLYVLIGNKLNYTNKKFVYSKTQLNLKNEGMKFLNWKNHKRYYLYDKMDNTVEIFLKRIKSIVENNMVKLVPLVLNDQTYYESKIDIANSYMSSRILSYINS